MNKKIKNKKKYLLIILIILIIFILISIILQYLDFYESKKDNDILKDFMKDNTNNSVDIEVTEQNISEGNVENDENIERIDKVKELQTHNSDIVGWIEIPNTNISYPILQGIDNSYYMKHNYKKKRVKDGSLFLDKDYDWNRPSENLLIYGHNNRGSKDMFVELLNYEDENFYKEHPQIRFTTTTEDGIYDIISVFSSRVYYKRETNVFRYYYFINANNKEEFDYYVQESKKASLYDINYTAEFGDQLITLSTCDWSKKDGRFVVVARKQN